VTTPGPRAARRASRIKERRAERRLRHSGHGAGNGPQERLRGLAFGLIATAVLAGGAWLAFGDLLGQRGTASAEGVIPVRLSMAGFTPGEIRVPAGQTVALELWTTDTAPHLDGGVHTLISDELGIHVELPAAGISGESRRIVQLEMPPTPGTYDIYCDTCCGGKQSPSMHGKLVVEA
jgi:cytochrome c oxidase subunit II